MHSRVLGFVSQLRRMRAQTLLLNITSAILVFTSALMTWDLFKVVLNNEFPIVVVLTGSMEPSYIRGDLLLVHDDARRARRIGDVLVYRLKGKLIPIVHRLLRVLQTRDGETRLLTKGDNNAHFDNYLYTDTTTLAPADVIGRIVAYVPGIGFLTILLKSHRWLRYPLFALLGAMALLGHEE
eukprot:gnl/Chilomastix_cuspidata/1172.p3 GENE.gnl/Chilomastix_cuspidata/1172~~gnl/Chilomastix_cuspidata/1172.p3  ORF type:complete len:182 (+),score=94.40 gnl/Chilomastix_cuspidata/1172:1019-1564(+)